MLDKLLDFFVGDNPTKEQNLTKRWLWTSFIAEFASLIFALVSSAFLKQPSDIYIFIGIFFIILLISVFLLSKNSVRFSSLFVSISGTITLLFMIYRFGGISSPAFSLLLVPITITAIFLRGRATLIVTVTSAVAGFLLMLAEITHLYQPDLTFFTPLASWVLYMVLFILVGTLLGIVSRQIRTSLYEANLEVDERRKVENALRRQTEYLTALHETALSITNRLDPSALLDSILVKTEEILGTPHAAIDLTLPPDGNTIKQEIGHGAFAAFHDQVVMAGQGITGTALMTGKTMVVDNYQKFTFASSHHTQAGFRAIACIPMILRDEVIGVISLAYTEEGKTFAQDQIELLEHFAELIGVALDNVRLYQDAQKELAERRVTEDALLESKERLRLALDAAHMGIWDWNIPSGRMLWSEQVYNIFDEAAKTFSGSYESFISLIHPADRKKVIQQVNASLNQPEKAFNVEFRVNWRSNQDIRWLEEKGRVYLDARGNPSYMSGTVTDITERKIAEEKLTGANKNLERYTAVLEQRSGQLKVAAEVSRAASEILDPTQLGQQVVDLVCERFHIYYAGLFLVDDKNEWAILTGASGEAGKKMLENNHRLRVGNTSMVGWSIFNRQPRIALDVGEDSVQVINPLLTETRSELALPLITRGQTIGALNIQTNKKAAFGKEEISIFQAMAGQLANAILNARLYAQLQHELEDRKLIEEEIRKLNTELEDRVQQRTSDLRASEEKFRALTENNPLQITRYDYDGRYLYVNRPDFDETLKAEDLIGKTIREVIEDQDFVDFAERSIQQVFETSKPLKTEYELGDEYAAWWLAPEYGPDGKVLSVIASAMDITERKRIEEELRQRSAELQATNKELEAFSYSISHDLRAPLRAIDGFTRIIAEDFKGTIPPEANPYFKHISDASAQMGQLIDDLLRLSRITRVELHPYPVDLSDLVVSIIHDLQNREPDRKIKVTIESGLSATGDERLLRVALENLLNNAWKFTSKVKDAHIEVGQIALEEKDAFFIKDNGVGFDMTYADKLFGAFQRLHSTDEFPGSGIGLAIVQRVINKHGGEIWVQSAPNQGATFFFTL